MTLSALGELVTFNNQNGFHHDGILYRSSKSNGTTVVHIHGSFGNFYQQHFVRTMASVYTEAGINFLSFNLTCHDGFGDAYHYEEEFGYEGGALSKFDTCLEDIEAAIKFVSPISQRVLLQGHSLGCDRLIYYLLSSKSIHNFILLSPADSYELQKIFIAPESVENQVARIRGAKNSENKFDWLPISEYGVRQGENWSYPNPITREAFLSISEGMPFRLFRISQPYSFWLPLSCYIFIGGEDKLQTWPSETMFSYFEERIKSVTRGYYPRCDHSIEPCDEEVANGIVNWINSLSS